MGQKKVWETAHFVPLLLTLERFSFDLNKNLLHQVLIASISFV